MVKFYNIIGFTEPVNLDPESPVAGHYMGKTSDLIFKTEPDKSIDLDDGTQEVGSEKLSVSFSCLEKLQNPAPIAELWIVPVSHDYMGGNVEIIRLDLRGCEYHLDSKSGEFEKILFSATLRYPVNSPPYRVADDYFAEYRIVLGRLQGDMNGDEVKLWQDNIVAAALVNEDMIIEHCFAFVGNGTAIDPSHVSFGNSELELYGLFGVIWFNPDGN